jgi:hypothetical protein
MDERRPSGRLWTASLGDFDWVASGTSGEKRQPSLMVPGLRVRRPIVLPYTPIGQIYAESGFHFSADRGAGCLRSRQGLKSGNPLHLQRTLRRTHQLTVHATARRVEQLRLVQP